DRIQRAEPLVTTQCHNSTCDFVSHPNGYDKLPAASENLLPRNRLRGRRSASSVCSARGTAAWHPLQPRLRRQAKPASPRRPVPSKAKLDGSGTAVTWLISRSLGLNCPGANVNSRASSMLPWNGSPPSDRAASDICGVGVLGL